MYPLLSYPCVSEVTHTDGCFPVFCLVTNPPPPSIYKQGGVLFTTPAVAVTLRGNSNP